MKRSEKSKRVYEELLVVKCCWHQAISINTPGPAKGALYMGISKKVGIHELSNKLKV